MASATPTHDSPCNASTALGEASREVNGVLRRKKKKKKKKKNEEEEEEGRKEEEEGRKEGRRRKKEVNGGVRSVVYTRFRLELSRIHTLKNRLRYEYGGKSQ